MQYIKVINAVKLGYKTFKITTDSYENIKNFKGDLENLDKGINEFNNVAEELKKVKDSGRKLARRLGFLNKQDKNPNIIIERPVTENKEEIYNWMYNESKKIQNAFINNITMLKEKYPFGTFSFSLDRDKDKLYIYIRSLSDWKMIKDELLIEQFSLMPRLEILNEYAFDEKEIKRINEFKELHERLNKNISNIKLVERFKDKDKLLAAYYYREFLNILLSDVYRSKTYKEMSPEEINEIKKNIEENLEYLRKKREKLK